MGHRIATFKKLHHHRLQLVSFTGLLLVVRSTSLKLSSSAYSVVYIGTEDSSGAGQSKPLGVENLHNPRNKSLMLSWKSEEQKKNASKDKVQLCTSVI